LICTIKNKLLTCTLINFYIVNNKEFVSELAQRMNLSQKEVVQYVSAFVDELSSNVIEGNQVAFLNLGTLEVRHKKQRISVSPITKERIVVPAKRVLAFKSSTGMKDKLKQLPKA